MKLGMPYTALCNWMIKNGKLLIIQSINVYEELNSFL